MKGLAWGEVAVTRHVIGYLCCLTFITFVLTFFGFFLNVVKNVEANAGTVFEGLKSDPTFGPLLNYTVQPFGASFSPALVMGHLIALILSPIGLFALLFYVIIAWMLPAR